MQLDHSKPYIIKIPDVLSPFECREFVFRIEQSNPEIATINTVLGAQVKLGVRNNERVMFSDPMLADTLFERVRPRAPAQIHGMSLVGVNELFRCYRYKPGMRFAPHADGAFHRNEFERSYYTFMVYLNADFEGGNTTFLVEPEVSIKPTRGMGLLFQHSLIHEGSLVTAGIKYVVRSDLMYRTERFTQQ